ncbi:E3 ubiquitin-protein ligase RZFP34 isoform X2 [Physcomitrium patens]|uniref:CHY-type domain-containing protein n=1 Tax=Physcomitrium patens TaxID=3218 RepID=A0A7I4AUH7_PHYPA|nr:E3 ubiquitin-protein ligase MIEL1-like isoform X2 [Physcomitrium patens]|eukprot:XP_024394321.1 E3 ubiquitin-protein ligase MIEL1-like isoform X2 [Physcomitrella patens]
MAVVAVRMESLLGPLVNGEQFRHGYSNVGAHSRQPVVAAHTGCSDSDSEDDVEGPTEDLVQGWKRFTGAEHHGCAHYKRGCKIRAPCCNEVFDCRHCHNDAKCIFRVSMRRMIHNATRLIGASWKRLSVPCAITSKMCNKFVKIVASVWASIFAPSASSLTMIIGGRDNFFHCDRCGCCYSVELRERHTCVEKSMHQDCAICMEYLFDSLMDITVLPCGHTLHLECLQEMYKHYQYNCPLCNKSVCDMSSVWKEIDLEIASIQMPENQSRMVWILCNDCGAKNEVRYHVVGQKCGTCPSYNTRLTESPASRTPS